MAPKGSPSRSPSALFPFLGEGSPTKLDYKKKGTLILTSLLEDLALYFWVPRAIEVVTLLRGGAAFSLLRWCKLAVHHKFAYCHVPTLIPKVRRDVQRSALSEAGCIFVASLRVAFAGMAVSSLAIVQRRVRRVCFLLQAPSQAKPSMRAKVHGRKYEN